MTLKELLNSIQKHLDSGSVSLDDNVYMATNILPYDETEIFSVHTCTSNEPYFDESDPSKNALFITAFDRVPNKCVKDKYCDYGTGYDVLMYDNIPDSKKLIVDIRQNKLDHLKKIVEVK